MEDEPGVTPGVARRFDGLVVPLQHALGLGERAVLLRDERRGDEEDLRAALLGLYAVHLPGGGGLYLVGVQAPEPVQVPQAVLGHLDVRSADREVLPEDEAALNLPVFHVHDRWVVGVVAREAREVVEDLIVPRRVERLAVPGLHDAGYVLGEVGPPARLGGLALHVVLPGVVVHVHVRHRQVAGEDVVKGRDVRRALDRRVAPERHDPATGPPYVPEEELQDGCGADDLNALGVLGPADRVAQRRRLLGRRVLADGLGDRQERLSRGAADLLDHLRRVLGEVTLEHLKDATLVLERRVARARLTVVGVRMTAGALADEAALAPPNGGVVDGRALVAPARRVVASVLLVPAGEEPVGAGVLELLGDEGGGVGVVDDVVLEVALVLEDVVDQAAKERYVRARPYGGVDVAQRARAREARVDVDELRALTLGDHGVPEADRVSLGHVRTLYEDAVGVLEVLQVGGGPTPTVRDAQTGHRGAVSYARLVRYPGEPHRVEELGDKVVLLVVYGGPTYTGDRHGAAELLALLILFFPVLVAGRLYPLGDHVERLVEREVLPLARVRPAVTDLGPTVRRDVHSERGRALRAERAGVYGAVGVPLDVYDAPVAVVDERGATDRAVGTHAHRPFDALVGDAGPDLPGRRAYGMFDRRPDVVPDLLPETVFLRELEEHT